MAHTFRQWRTAVIAVVVFVLGVLIISVVSGRGLSRVNWGWVGLVALGHFIIIGPLFSAFQRRRQKEGGDKGQDEALARDDL